MSSYITDAGRAMLRQAARNDLEEEKKLLEALAETYTRKGALGENLARVMKRCAARLEYSLKIYDEETERVMGRRSYDL